MFGKLKNAKILMDIKQGKLPLSKIEAVLEDADADQNIDMIADILNENLQQWRKLLDLCGIDHDHIGRFDIEDIKKVFDTRNWAEASMVIMSAYQEEKRKLMQAVAEEHGLSSEEVDQVIQG